MWRVFITVPQVIINPKGTWLLFHKQLETQTGLNHYSSLLLFFNCKQVLTHKVSDHCSPCSYQLKQALITLQADGNPNRPWSLYKQMATQTGLDHSTSRWQPKQALITLQADGNPNRPWSLYKQMATQKGIDHYSTCTHELKRYFTIPTVPQAAINSKGIDQYSWSCYQLKRALITILQAFFTLHQTAIKSEGLWSCSSNSCYLKMALIIAPKTAIKSKGPWSCFFEPCLLFIKQLSSK